MIYLPKNKQPKPYYTLLHRFVGILNIPDGLVDITDPGYDGDNWCNILNKRIKQGKYKCYIDAANYPTKYRLEGTDYKVLIGKKKAGNTITQNDRRIISVTIEHESAEGIPYKYDGKGWKLITKNIGVDAGLCGFYNHKPDFSKDNDWLDFCDSLKNFPRYQSTCDLRNYGITVSSGFGDGAYPLYALKDNDGQIIALKLVFY